MAMTLAQAKKFIRDSERMPPDEVDVDRLLEAVEVFEKAGAKENEYRGRAAEIASKITDRASLIRSQQQIDTPTPAGPGPGRPGEPLEPGRLRGGGTPQSRTTQETARRQPTLPGQLVDRFFKAAERAGVPADQARQLLEEAQAGASGTITLPDGQVVTLPPDPNAPGPEELIEAQILDWTQGAIGVPDGFFAQKQEDIQVGEGLEKFRQARGIQPGQQTREIAARYFEGDELNFAGLPPEEVSVIQRRLVEAGLMDEGEYWAGVWDPASMGAIKSVMGMANASGNTLDDQLDFLIANVPDSVKEARNAAKLAKQFQAPPFLKPDPASLAQDVKGLMRQKLGREPSDEEMGELTSVLSGAFRSDYEAEVAAMRSSFAAQEQGLETGVAVTPGAVQDVDPQARFQQAFDQKFAPEMDFIEGQSDQVRNATNVFASLRNMSGLIG